MTARVLFLVVTVLILVSVEAYPTVPEVAILKPADPSADPTLTVPVLKPADPDLSEMSKLIEDTERSAVTGDLDAIVVGEGETTTFQPFDPSDCSLPKERGPCRALLDAYFFNSATKTCEVFSWSGCGGNANRFSTLQRCEAACNELMDQKLSNQQSLPTASIASESLPTASIASENSTISEDSALAPENATISGDSTLAPENSTISGDSAAVKPKPKLPVCPKFGGCGPKCVIIQDRSDRGCKRCLCGDPVDAAKHIPGSVVVSSGNITVSKSTGSVSGLPKDAEEEPISGNPSENCKLPTKRGNCRGMMTRYHYDPAIKDCTVFHYGGCDGNLNNFVSKEKCLEYCKGQ